MRDSHIDHNDEVAKTVLEVLDKLGIPWVVVSSPRSGGGDLDIVTSLSGSTVVAELRRSSASPEAIMTVEYDIGDSEAIWFANPDGSVISHIDFLADTAGQGRLAIPVGQILATAVNHQPSPAWQLTYVVSKKVAKGNWEHLANLDYSPQDVDEISLSAVFGPHAHLVTELITKRATASEWASNGKRLRRAMWRQRANRTQFGTLGLVALITKRYLKRMLHPVAPWIHVSGPGSETAAPNLAVRLGQNIQRARLRRIRGMAIPQLISGTAFRLRPGVFVTYGRRRVIGIGVVELPADSDSVDAMIRKVVPLLAARVEAR